MNSKSNFEKAFYSDMSGKRKKLACMLINPPIEDPWRIKEDYQLEQKRETTKFCITIASLVISVISVCATSFVALYTINRIGL